MPNQTIDRMNERELREAVAAKSRNLAALWGLAVVEDAEGRRYDLMKITALEGDSKARLEKLQAMGRELDEYKAALDERLESGRMAQRADELNKWSNEAVGGIIHPNGGEKPKQDMRGLGTILVNSPAYQRYRSSRNWPETVDLPQYDIRNAVFRTGSGWAPPQIREPGFVPDSTIPVAVVDFIPTVPTGADVIRFMREDAITDVAAETAESTATTAADLIPEATRTLTEQTRNVEWIPVFLPVTIQQMEDVDGIEAYINMTLGLEVQRRLDQQTLRGNGTSPNLLGTNSVTGRNTQAKGTDPTLDAIFKGMQLVRGEGTTPGHAEPSVVFIHPADWTPIRLLRTADGIYIFGSPTEPGPERLWGVRMVQTAMAAENTITLGDYARFSTLHVKRGLTLAVSDSHAHYFTRGMLAVRADMRVAMVHRRPRAFCTVTGV